MFTYIKPKIGDLLAYNTNTQTFVTIKLSRYGKEDDKYVIGIIVNVNEDLTIDVLMKHYLTAESIRVPINYTNGISVYLKQLFDRYCTKYRRTLNIDITDFKYTVPSIAFMDFVYKNIDKFKETLVTMYGQEDADMFLYKMFNNGIFTTHTNKKFYCWKIGEDGKRVIENFEAFKCYEFLPMFTLQYNI